MSPQDPNTNTCENETKHPQSTETETLGTRETLGTPPPEPQETLEESPPTQNAQETETQILDVPPQDPNTHPSGTETEHPQPTETETLNAIETLETPPPQAQETPTLNVGVGALWWYFR